MNKQGITNKFFALMLIVAMAALSFSAFAANVHDPNTGAVVGELDVGPGDRCFETPTGQMVCPGTPEDVVGACIQDILLALPDSDKFLSALQNCVDAGGPQGECVNDPTTPNCSSGTLCSLITNRQTCESTLNLCGNNDCNWV